MRILWPTKLNPTPNGFTRFGRVLHWIAAAFTIPTIIACIYFGLHGSYLMSGGEVTRSYTRYDGSLSYYTEVPGTQEAGVALGIGVLAVLIYFAGRALRYIFSGE